MSALALTATYTVTAVIGMAAMYVPARLARYDARAYNALAEDKLTACEARDAAFEETRNKPWYWPTDPAIEADKPHDAEVLHVAYPTQELRLVADDPQVAAGLAALADEVGLVQALSDESEHTAACPDLYYCPTVDEVESACHGGFDVCCWAPELHQPVEELRTMPALSDRPAEDEDEVGDEQPGEALSSVPSRIGGWWREQRARFRELFRFRSSAPVNPPYRGRHWVSDVQHTGTFPIVKATGGPVNAVPYIEEPPGCIIPTQRDGEVQA